ncbi:c-type cytochrome [Luteitalea sp.]|uniref:c-type cytochrome n=1 Tax=Luteitalea sp. TaxID=2004800 RepID=UPI000AFFA530|nr:c-type cytochrome [Luteitalea sp.]
MLTLAASVCLRATTPARNDAAAFPDIVDHFKYGSIGAEASSGLPYWIWKVLPEVCEDALPTRPGSGYERIGFLDDGAGHGRPIGTSFRPGDGDLVGLNCATCHVGTLRETVDAPRRVIVGMPANQMDLQGYGRFLTACAQSPAFETGRLIDSIRRANPEFGFFQRLAYRLFVVRAARNGILERAKENAWFDDRPPFGPGRVDTFNPYKVLLRLPLDTTVGTVDLPSIWNQRPRQGLWLHWDGNNDRVEERNKSAAIGAGATPASLDLPSMRRIEHWLLDFPAPAYPEARLDRSRAAAGRSVYASACASCHDIGAAGIGQVTPIEEIGTDRGRLDSFTPALATAMNTIGKGRPWQFARFRKTGGYANMPLDGLWLRAPYLHNGSVPDLRALLFPEERPTTFIRAYDVYDWDRVGFVSQGAAAEREGVRFDTTQRGNANTGHTYGVTLPSSDKLALLEYLKTL